MVLAADRSSYFPGIRLSLSVVVLVKYVAPPVFVTWCRWATEMETPIVFFTFKEVRSGGIQQRGRDAIPGGSSGYVWQPGPAFTPFTKFAAVCGWPGV